MARSIARGKALVAKLSADPKVRDPEALAAWIGRHKHRKKSGGSLAERVKSSSAPTKESKRSPFASKPTVSDDPFADDPFADDEPESKEDKQRKRMEDALLRKMEKEDRSTLHNAIMEQGGIRTSDELREEYRQIPNNLKRKDGMAGDEMADYLKTYYQELGIETERDLIDYFQRDFRRAA